MRSRDHLSYVIIQCYLPPGRGDSPNFTLTFTSTHFTIPQKVEGRVDLGQGAYNSGKPGKLREFVNSGKLGEFIIYSGNLSDACCFFVTQSETHRKMT